jgi:hypothetical protein
MHPHDERHFNMLFEYAPISLWEEDFSEIKQLFNRLPSRCCRVYAAT